MRQRIGFFLKKARKRLSADNITIAVIMMARNLLGRILKRMTFTRRKTKPMIEVKAIILVNQSNTLWDFGVLTVFSGVAGLLDSVTDFCDLLVGFSVLERDLEFCGLVISLIVLALRDADEEDFLEELLTISVVFATVRFFFLTDDFVVFSIDIL